MRSLSSLVAVLAMCACSSGPSTPTDYCDQLASTTCNRIYGCATGSALDLIKAQLGDTPEQCAAFEQGQLECANISCLAFSSASASSCLSALNAETCDSITNGDTPAICNDVCGGVTPQPDGGPPVAQCVDGFEACGDICSDISDDPNNCGGCGVSCGGNECIDGECATVACVNDDGACTVDGDCCSLFCAADNNCRCINSGDTTTFCSQDNHCCSCDCNLQTGICN